MTVQTSNPRIEITPSGQQYEQLCRDLAALRRAGASSNTAAVLQAVRAAAADKLGNDQSVPGSARPGRHRSANGK